MTIVNLQTKKIEVIPAVLVKTRELFLNAIKKIRPYVKTAHIDVMDNKFVPNLTLGLNELKYLPKNIKYEFHWMVKNPEEWIKKMRGDHLHIVHVETINNWEKIKKTIKQTGGKIGLAINPETSVEKIAGYAKDVEQLLVMTVHPGFSGQKYIKKMKQKISYLRKNFPKLNIEVDGGIDIDTAVLSVKAGANKLAAASTIFKAENIGNAIKKLKEAAKHV